MTEIDHHRSRIDVADAPAARPRRVLPAILPLVLFLVVGAFLYVGLFLNPKLIPSALIGRPVPQFELPALAGRDGPGLGTADLQQGEVSLVNVFASWCVACRVEHPLLMALSQRSDVPIHALNYKDEPEAALAWLKRFGDPYDRVGVDRNGRVGIDWGVYGVPESFVVDGEGRIVCKHLGPITERDWADKLRPAIEAARAGRRTAC